MSLPTICDQLLASNWPEQKGTPFESFLAQVFDALGYAVEKSGAQSKGRLGDNGVDLFVSKARHRFAIQAKGYPSGNQVGVDAVMAVIAGRQYYGCKGSLVVTNSTFTPNARKMATQLGCRLVDKDRIPYLIRGQVLPLYPSEFTFACQRCMKKVSVSTTLCGRQIRCLSCAGESIIPQYLFSPNERFRQGRKLIQEGDQEEGNDRIVELLQTHPLFKDPLLYLAERLFVHRRFPKALQFYQKAIQLGGCSPVMYAHAAQAACESGACIEARRLLDLAIQHFGRSKFTAAMWVAFARVDAQMGETKAAVRYVRRAIKAGGTNPTKYEKDPLLNPLLQDRSFKRLMIKLRTL